MYRMQPMPPCQGTQLPLTCSTTGPPTTTLCFISKKLHTQMLSQRGQTKACQPSICNRGKSLPRRLPQQQRHQYPSHQRRKRVGLPQQQRLQHRSHQRRKLAWQTPQIAKIQTTQIPAKPSQNTGGTTAKQHPRQSSATASWTRSATQRWAASPKRKPGTRKAF